MNKIVREHYPVEKLPADLREGLEGSPTVRIILEAQESGALASRMSPSKPFTLEESLDAVRNFRAKGTHGVTMEEAVARVRALRDEWDD
ncbi:hypothetical protein ABID16_002195 [Rhizobium aquaticum]|uniref:Uncharacterized protein n=1 Tax=Rhizobium aquaticum TaxID=1549636 RepID=A0ABV2IZF7_9HYPH